MTRAADGEKADFEKSTLNADIITKEHPTLVKSPKDQSEIRSIDIELSDSNLITYEYEDDAG